MRQRPLLASQAIESELLVGGRTVVHNRLARLLGLALPQHHASYYGESSVKIPRHVEISGFDKDKTDIDAPVEALMDSDFGSGLAVCSNGRGPHA